MSLHLALIQMDIQWHDRPANFATARRLALKAKEEGADVLVLPEMFATGFSMETAITGEPLTGETPAFLRSLASEFGMGVVGGFALQHGRETPRNVALAVDPRGDDTALYTKIHRIGLLEEDLHYAPGTLPVPFDLNGLPSACFICYDLRFPELFRCVADACSLVLVIASWPSPRQEHWDLLLRARAVENQCYVAGVNRVGHGGGHDFTGGSVVLDPLGECLAHAGDREALITATVDPERVREVRKSFPFLRDRQRRLFALAGGLDDPPA